MDRFVGIYHIQNIYDNIRQVREDIAEHKLENSEDFDVVNQRLLDAEAGLDQLNQDILRIDSTLQEMNKALIDAKNQLIRTNIVQVKQGIMVRTMHNLTVFDADYMFIDTFVDKTGIDEERSIRADLIPEAQAIGVTNFPIVDVEQPIADSSFLLSGNGSSDQTIAQSFFISKERLIDTISLQLETTSFSVNSPITVSIRENLDGPDLVSKTLNPNELSIEGWTNIQVPMITLEENIRYYIVITTDDTYGYRIGFTIDDAYLPGTCYTLNENAWSDIGSDIAFKIWGYKTVDEFNTTVYTKPKTLNFVPHSIIFEKDDSYESVPIQYHVSRDDGANWKILQPGIETSLDDLPEGQTILVRGYLVGNSMINAWGYVITGGVNE